MNTPRKFWLVLIGAVLAMVVIACSCGSLTPTPTSTPPPTSTPRPTVPVNPMPGLEGYWLDSDTQVVHTIEWQNGQYVVISAIDVASKARPLLGHGTFFGQRKNLVPTRVGQNQARPTHEGMNPPYATKQIRPWP